MSQSFALQTMSLSKVFGVRTALNNLSFTLPKGAFLSIFGPNGAGKTTLLRILATLVRPSSGNAQVLGYDLKKNPHAIRAHIGLISHQSMLYPDLSAEENLLITARLYGVSAPKERVTELLATVELTARRHDVVRTFSRGMVQRLAIARTLIHDPALIFLDEPYSGLDPHAVEIFDALLARIKDTTESTTPCSFCMVSHDLNKGLSLATHLLILERGKMVLFDEKDKVDLAYFKSRYHQSVGMGMA